MVENSLGRLWTEGHGKPENANWKYYLKEAEQEDTVKADLEKLRAAYREIQPEQIKIIDPCMGSGHILVYAFDVLMDIYTACGWSERDAAKSILRNNLYGLDIDDRAAQLAILKERHHADPLDAVRPVTDIATLQRLIDEVSAVYIADSVYDYVARLAEGTRTHPYVELGVSPRGALAICRCAKACAYLDRRDYVVPEDVAAVLPDVCAHRLVMSAKARLHDYTPAAALAELLQTVTPPSVREFRP